MRIEDSLEIARDITRSYGLKDGSKRAVLTIASILGQKGLEDGEIRQILDDFLNDILRYEFGEED